MALKGNFPNGMTAYAVGGAGGKSTEKATGGAAAHARFETPKTPAKEIASSVAGSAPAAAAAAAAPIASDMSGDQQQGISHHMGGQRAHVSHAQALRLLNVPGATHTSQKRTVYLETKVTLKDLMKNPKNGALKMEKVAADLFKKPVYNTETKRTDMKGEVNNSQVTEIELISYNCKLPVEIGLESFEVLGNTAPRIISGKNGRLFTCILGAETNEIFAKPRLLHKNETVINPKQFNMWSGVTVEQLKEGSHPHPLNPALTFVELVKNKRIKILLKTNIKRLEKDFESFSFRDMAYELNRSNGANTVISTEAHEKLIEMGLKLGITPVQEGSVSLYDLSFQPISLTSKTGDFSDLKDELVSEYGAELAEQMMDQSYCIKATMSISAVVAGTEPESDEEPAKKTAAAAESDDESGKSRDSTPAASDSEHSAASSDAE